jgi:hypothetical protein
MKVTIDFDDTQQGDLDALHRIFGGVEIASKPAKRSAKRATKPTEPVAGNPDMLSKGDETAVINKADLAAAVAQAELTSETEAEAVSLPDNAPKEIIALLRKVDKETIGQAILKMSKTLEEGGRGRDVAVAILEQFRPKGNTETLVKVRHVSASDYPAIAKLVLEAYAS